MIFSIKIIWYLNSKMFERRNNRNLFFTEWNSKDRNAPIRAFKEQLITVEHHAYKITHDQSTLSPEED